MIRYSLLGRHSNKTPLSYQSYRDRASEYFECVDDVSSSDVIVFGFISDVKENRAEVVRALKKNPSVKLVVISEEPLLDTICGRDYSEKIHHVDLEGAVVVVYYLNHFTTSIFDFNKIPYYITIDYKFISSYRLFLDRNVRYSLNDLKEHLNNSRGEAFFVERRFDARYQFDAFSANNFSAFRSGVAEIRNTKNSRTLLVRKGWDENLTERKHSDWHLDKIQKIDRKFKFCSAIENADVENYISEKFFDAISALSIPLVSTRINLNKLYPFYPHPFLNLDANNTFESNAKIENFAITDDFLDAYMDCLKYWLFIFRDFFLCEMAYRDRLVSIYKELSELMNLPNENSGRFI